MISGLTNVSNSLAKQHIRRKVFSFNKSVSGASIVTAVASSGNLSLADDERIYMSNVHQTYRDTTGTFVANIELSYRVADDNRSVLISIYNPTSASKTITLQVETICIAV